MKTIVSSTDGTRNVRTGSEGLKVWTVADYLEIRDRRRALEKEARELSKIEKAMEEEMIELVKLVGEYEECGHRVKLGEKPGRVAWKQEFVKRLGEAEAARVQAECPPKVVLVIEEVKK